MSQLSYEVCGMYIWSNARHSSAAAALVSYRRFTGMYCCTAAAVLSVREVSLLVPNAAEIYTPAVSRLQSTATAMSTSFTVNNTEYVAAATRTFQCSPPPLTLFVAKSGRKHWLYKYRLIRCFHLLVGHL